MVYIFIFQVLSLRKAAEIDYQQIALSKEITFLSGIGFKNIILKKYPQRKRKSLEYSCIQKDETVIKVGSEYIWIWVATIELESKGILGISVSKEQNMFVAIERFISDVVEEYGEHPVSTDGGTWYPQACRFLNLNHHLHSSYEKSIIERTMQYIKDRTKNVLMIIFLVEKRNVN